jgi:hypothetical protein
MIGQSAHVAGVPIWTLSSHCAARYQHPRAMYCAVFHMDRPLSGSSRDRTAGPVLPFNKTRADATENLQPRIYFSPHAISVREIPPSRHICRLTRNHHRPGGNLYV